MDENVQGSRFPIREKPKPNRNITKDDIGYPTNFTHTVHISWNPDGIDIKGDESVLSTVLQKHDIPKEVRTSGFNFRKHSVEKEEAQERISRESFSRFSFTDEELQNNVTSTTQNLNKRASLPARHSTKDLHLIRSISQEHIGDPYDFRHVCHVTWEIENGFRIRSDIPSFGEVLQKEIICSKLNLKTINASMCKSKIEYNENDDSITQEAGSSKDACLNNPERSANDVKISPESTSQKPDNFQLDFSENNQGKPKHKSKINKEDIGNPFEFRHISHVGWDAENGFNRWSMPVDKNQI